MLRPRRVSSIALAFVVMMLVSASGACDGGPDDAAPDAHPAPSDVGPCGAIPPVFCLPGAIGRVCGEGSTLMTCHDTFWQCPSGTVVPSNCGCRAEVEDGSSASKNPGDACDEPDAGSDSANDAFFLDVSDAREDGDVREVGDDSETAAQSPP